MLQTILNLLGKFGNVMDLPGSSVRDLITGNNPFDQWMTPTEDVNRVSGRDVLSKFGLMRPNHETGMSGWLSDPGEGVRDIGGALLEGLLDPTNLLPANWVGKVLKSRKAIAAANAAIGGKYGYVNPKVAARPAAEVVSEVASSPMKLLGYTPEPELAYHGGHKWTNVSDTHPYGKPVINSGKVGEGAQFYGPGVYFAQDPNVTRRYRRLAMEKLKDSPEILDEYFKPGNVVPSYSGKQRVLEYKNGVVTAEELQHNGVDWVPTGRQLVHATRPDLRQLSEFFGQESLLNQRTAQYGLSMPPDTLGRLMSHEDYSPLSDLPTHPTAQRFTDARAAAQEVKTAIQKLNDRKGRLSDIMEKDSTARESAAQAANLSGDDAMSAVFSMFSDSPLAQVAMSGFNQTDQHVDTLEGILRNLRTNYGMEDAVDHPWFRITGVEHPGDTALEEVKHLIDRGIPGSWNFSSASPGTSNFNIWDQNVLDQMKVREINGEKVPWNLMLPIQQQPTARVLPGPESPLAPTMAQRQIPASLRSPLAAGFMYNMLARQRGEL